MEINRDKLNSGKKCQREVKIEPVAENTINVSPIRKRAPYSYNHVSNEKRRELLDRVIINKEMLARVILFEEIIS